MRLHRFSLLILYTLTLAAIVLLVVHGWTYYRLPLLDRPHSALYDSLKPNGFLGHGIGIAGSALMLILFLYSARKRLRAFQRLGNIRYWLNYHIWMGVTGPLLVLFHTTFKFGGIVAISFWSMVAVALSGVLGRYIYVQIPRSLSGHELTRQELLEMDRGLLDRIRSEYERGDRIAESVQRITSGLTSRSEGWSNLILWLKSDLTLPFRMANLRRELKRLPSLDRSQVKTIVRLARNKAVLHRRISFLQSAHRLLNYWHVIHKPFAVVMILIMIVHVVIAVLFGYTWIF